MKVHCIRHEPFEGLACIEDWLKQHQHTVTYTYTYLNQALPVEYDFELVVIMGGTSSVYESLDNPWFIEELYFLENCIKRGIRVLGICLGSQILAHLLGARVYKAPEMEIGWFPVTFNRNALTELNFLPDKLNTFHWHGDTYDLPSGATRFASSELTPNQGFIYQDQIIGLQFHPEVKSENIAKLIKGTGWNLRNGGNYMQTEKQILDQLELISPNIHFTHSILDYLVTRERVVATNTKIA